VSGEALHGLTRSPIRGVVSGVYVAAVLAYALYAAVGFGDDATDDLFQGVYIGAMFAAAILCGVRALRVAKDRPAWAAIAFGQLSWALGTTYNSVVLAADPTPPAPSPADGLYLIYYPASVLGVALLVRSRIVRHQATVWLDGLTAWLAVAAVGAAVLLPPILDAGADHTLALATTLAYPLGDLLLLCVVLAGMTVGKHRPGLAWYMLAIGLVTAVITDALYLRAQSAGSYSPGSLLAVGWMTAVGLVAAAAWQRSPRAVSEAAAPPGSLASLACAVAALALSAYGVLVQLTPLAAGLTAATLLVVVVRLGLTLRDNRALLERTEAEATTDALTGLGNRRLLMPALGRACGSAGATLALFDLDGFKRYNDTFGHPAGDALLQRLATRLLATAERHGGTAYRMGGDEFCLLLPAPAAASAAAIEDAVDALSERGEGFTVSTSHGSVSLPDEAGDAVVAMRLADQRLYGRKTGRRSAPYVQARAALRQVLDEAEPELGRRGQSVAELATAMGRRLGMDAEGLDELARAAELHDIGKVAIPDEILHKPGPLTDKEWRLVREHSVIGERIISAAPALASVGRIVRSTHERWDGRGYPDGLAGEEIPLAARLIAVCDAYDAMTSGRPYRKPISAGTALAELLSCRGAQFDPAAVEAFQAVLAEAHRVPPRRTPESV
jgi:two-component system, cell cycle response regulator